MNGGRCASARLVLPLPFSKGEEQGEGLFALFQSEEESGAGVRLLTVPSPRSRRRGTPRSPASVLIRRVR
jgi:hypothetical protein